MTDDDLRAATGRAILVALVAALVTVAGTVGFLYRMVDYRAALIFMIVGVTVCGIAVNEAWAGVQEIRKRERRR